jgi:hypothetical protein
MNIILDAPHHLECSSFFNGMSKNQNHCQIFCKRPRPKTLKLDDFKFLTQLHTFLLLMILFTNLLIFLNMPSKFLFYVANRKIFGNIHACLERQPLLLTSKMTFL